MQITQRPATEDDLAFAREVHHISYRDVVMAQFGKFIEEEQDEFFLVGWRSSSNFILLCDGKPCGYLCLMDGKDNNVCLRELVIHPDYQKRGVGAKIIQNVIKVAKARGIGVELSVLHKNRAQNFYKTHGFAECGRTDTHLLMKLSCG